MIFDDDTINAVVNEYHGIGPAFVVAILLIAAIAWALIA